MHATHVRFISLEMKFERVCSSARKSLPFMEYFWIVLRIVPMFRQRHICKASNRICLSKLALLLSHTARAVDVFAPLRRHRHRCCRQQQHHRNATLHIRLNSIFIHKTNCTVGSCLSSSQNVISIRCGLLLLAFHQTSEREKHKVITQVLSKDKFKQLILNRAHEQIFITSFINNQREREKKLNWIK